MRKTMVMSTVALVAALPVQASAQDVPEALQGLEDLSYQGDLGGMDVWVQDGSDEVYMIGPDGRTIMRGDVFNANGRDVGAVYTGATPGDLFVERDQQEDAGNAPVPPRQNAENSNDAPDLPEPDITVSGTEEGFGSFRSVDSCQSPISNSGAFDLSGGGAEEASDDVARGNVERQARQDAAPSTDGARPIDGGEVARTAEEALAEFNDDERRALLLELVEGLRDAETQETFVQGIVNWRLRIDEMRQEKGLPSYFTPDGISLRSDVENRGEPDVTNAASSEETSEEDLPVASAEPRATVEAATEVSGSDANIEERLLEDVRRNALWFSVGSTDAPTVYAFIDPTCPYCARAISVLSEKIGAGELQLRVALAPVVSRNAPGVIAGIFNAENPPLAFFDHEVEKDKFGRSELDTAAFNELPGALQAGVRRNYDMIVDYEIPGVPFFVYETEDGAEAFSGVPDGISFPGAVVDSYTGTN